MSQYIYTMQRVGKIVPPKTEIIKDISLSFLPGAKIGVLGINGAGKSTVLRIMAGKDKDYIGEARAQPNIKIGYLAQEPELDEQKTVRENVEDGMGESIQLLKAYNAISDKFAEPEAATMTEAEMTSLLEQQGKLQQSIDDGQYWDIQRSVDMAGDALRLPPWEANVTNLSGGEKRRVALCKLLLSKPDMLLLDEPTNHLDAESVAWLERFLHDFSGTVVAVTHDRYFLDNVADWILELDRGRGFPYQGNYSTWLEQKEKRMLQESREEEAHEKALKAELEWVRTNPKGRQAKSKSRLQRFHELYTKEFQKLGETNELYIPPGPRLGDIVINAENLSKQIDDRIIFENLNFSVPNGAIVGIIGPNGAGKSTLFKMIIGESELSGGNLIVGETVQLAYVSQSRDLLDGNKTVWEEVSGGLDIMQIGQFQMASRSYVGRFNFKGPAQQKRIGDLSGGERNRVHLAKLLSSGGNVLLLDEPTNDLDVGTLRALEEALLTFPGSALVISHDRWFLDRVATHILSFEDDGSIIFLEGNFGDYESDRKKRLGDKAKQPHRMRHKKLDL